MGTCRFDWAKPTSREIGLSLGPEFTCDHETVVKQETCKVAIIGAGSMAREHLRAFQDVAGVDVAGLRSRTRARADSLAAAHGVAIVCDSLPELYEKTRADLVVIAVDVIELAAVSRACFEFPWTVLVEKPVGYNFVEAQEVQQAAASKRRKVLVALNRRGGNFRDRIAAGSARRACRGGIAVFSGPDGRPADGRRPSPWCTARRYSRWEVP